MKKNELIEFLRENLEIEIDFTSSFAAPKPTITAILRLDGEIISKNKTDVRLSSSDVS